MLQLGTAELRQRIHSLEPEPRPWSAWPVRPACPGSMRLPLVPRGRGGRDSPGDIRLCWTQELTPTLTLRCLKRPGSGSCCLMDSEPHRVGSSTAEAPLFCSSASPCFQGDTHTGMCTQTHRAHTQACIHRHTGRYIIDANAYMCRVCTDTCTDIHRDINIQIHTEKYLYM